MSKVPAKGVTMRPFHNQSLNAKLVLGRTPRLFIFGLLLTAASSGNSSAIAQTRSPHSLQEGDSIMCAAGPLEESGSDGNNRVEQESGPNSDGGAKESRQLRLKEATSHLSKNRAAEALKILEPLLDEAKSSADAAILPEAEYRTAVARFILNEHQKSRDHFLRAIELARKQSNRLLEAQALRGLGQVYKVQGSFIEAIARYDQALAIFESLGNRQGSARTWFNLGAAYDSMGEYRRALDYYQKAEAVFQDLKDPSLFNVLMNTGITCKNLGRYKEALDYYDRALNEQRRIEDKLGQALTLGNMGVVYRALGQEERAIEYHQQSLALFRETGERRNQSIALTNLGDGYKAIGDYPRALDTLQQALALGRQLGDRNNEAITLKSLGDIQLLLGNLKEARSNFEQAAKLHHEASARTYEGSALLALADVSLREGNAAGSQRLGEQALELAEQTGSPELNWSARHVIARALRASGRTADAAAQLRLGIETINSVRARVVADTSKITYLDARQAIFHELIDLLYQQRRFGEALETAEAARTRALIDLLAERQITLKPAEAARVTAIRDLEARLRTETRSTSSGAPAPIELAMRRAASEDSLKRGLQSLQEDRNELASLLVAKPLALPELTGEVKRLQATLIEYLATEERLFIWTVAPAGDVRCVAVELPRQKLRKLVKDLHEKLDNFDLAALRNQRPLRAQLKELHRVTIAPIAPSLPRDPEALVYVVPHDALFLVPFAALIDENGHTWAAQHTIVSAPSITVMRYAREKKKFVVSPAKPHLLAIADPKPPEGANLGPLPGARAEVQRISQFFSPRQTMLLTGENASEANVKRLSAGQTILHFAVHGLVYDDRPWESALVLAAGEGEDGWLKVDETFGLDLHADLVVLSGCSTGLGKLSGDGMIGLARAFIYAGTPSIIVSRWDVSDEPPPT